MRPLRGTGAKRFLDITEFPRTRVFGEPFGKWEVDQIAPRGNWREARLGVFAAYEDGRANASAARELVNCRDKLRNLPADADLIRSELRKIDPRAFPNFGLFGRELVAAVREGAPANPQEIRRLLLLVTAGGMGRPQDFFKETFVRSLYRWFFLVTRSRPPLTLNPATTVESPFFKFIRAAQSDAGLREDYSRAVRRVGQAIRSERRAGVRGPAAWFALRNK